ncbi:hypothetical protein MJO52_12705 [Microbulbifer variabilis]|uniref:Large polyvalent protein associated domain-containing protein n=1 Tax=Microbulbifer variabilis TaxID=266805 RepID=A0ABY4V6S9_9GAMM|nr:hypothetical protein [Microbulbifer variabilis]USD19938.1 hypothetical protein MJO52_12705 [Microbulbifer variabilis]
MALTIAEIRKQYPEYSDMSDEALARSLHQSYYSDMEFGEFAGKIGYTLPDPAGINQPGSFERFVDNSVGEFEVLGAVGSSVLAEPISGLAGIAQSLNPWAEPGAGAQAVEATRDFLTYEPRTDEGRDKLNTLSDFIEPAGRAMEYAEKSLGDATYNATGSPALAAGAASVPTAILELLGVGLGKGATQAKRATPENVKTELTRLGVDSHQMSEEAVLRVVEELNEGADFSSDALVGVLENVDMPEDWVPKTRAEQQGIETGNFDLWRKQNEAAAGVYGSDAEQTVNRFTDFRERQLGKVVPYQMDDLGPTEGASSLASNAGMLYDGILSKVENAKQAKTDAYTRVDDIAKERGPMMAEGSVMQEGLGAAYRGFDGDIKLASKTETPNAYGLFEKLHAALRGEKSSGLPGALTIATNKMESLDNFESLRRRISAAERASAPGSADQALLGQVRRQYGSWLDEAVENGKFFGSPEQLDALKEARRLNREYMQIVKGTHKDGKPTARTRIVNDVVNGRSTPEKVVNKIIGGTGKKQGAAIVEDFKRLFGEDSPEFGALRQSAFMNIFGPAFKVAEDGSLQLSRGSYINRLSDQLKNNESNLRALFDESEVGRWNKFSGELRKLQEDVRKKNFSGSAYHLAGPMSALIDRVGIITQWLPFMREGAESVSKSRRWRDLRKNGLAEGDFTVSSDTATLLGALLGGAPAPSGVSPALLLSEDDEPRNQGVLAIK